MKNYRNDLFTEFIKRDEKLQELYRQIENHPNHKRKITLEESLHEQKGKIIYDRRQVTIEINTKLGEESILILAHELMHYLLVLDGALLPITVKENVSSKAESLEYILMKSITHHFLLKQKLDSIGFQEIQVHYALRDELEEVPSWYYHDEEFWLLELYDRSTFAKNYDFVALEERFELRGLNSVYELLQKSPKKTIEDINALSKSLIREFNCENILVLKELDEYTSW